MENQSPEQAGATAKVTGEAGTGTHIPAMLLGWHTVGAGRVVVSGCGGIPTMRGSSTGSQRHDLPATEYPRT